MSMAAILRRGTATILQGMGGIRKEEAAAAAATWHSRLIRRRNSTAFTLEEEEEEESLYLCFWELKGPRHCSIYSMQSIRLSHLLQGRSSTTDISGAGDYKSPLDLQEAAFRGDSDADVPRFVSLSPSLGSKFIFTTSSDYGIVERGVTTETLNPKPYFLLEVDGKFFRFRFRDQPNKLFVPYLPCELFEVFDPDSEEWFPLDLPPTDPTIADGYLLGIDFENAVAGSNILRWARKCGGIYRFDVTHPEQGWTELDNSCVECFEGDAEVMQQHDHDHNGFVIFSCKRDLSEIDIQVFLMSQEWDSLKRMQPLQVGQFCPPGFAYPEECCFVHLVGRKVGLAFKSCRPIFDGYYNVTLGFEKVDIFLITFEYELVTTEDHALEVKTKLLTTRCLEYDPGKRCEGKTYDTDVAGLIGAYVH